MNKATRKQIEGLIARAQELFDEVQTLQQEEQDKYDNMPESLQDGEPGQLIAQAADVLDSACTSLEEAIQYLTETIEN